MSLKEGFSKRNPAGQSAQSPGGYVNAPKSASEGQVQFINDLRAKCGMEPLTSYEASRMSPSEAAREINELKREVPPPDLDECPENWDKDIWRLTLLFEERAAADEIELAAGRNIVYAEINDLVTRYGIRDQTFRHEIDGCTRRTLHSKLAAHCWLHYPPLRPGEQKTGAITWVEIVEVIILEFWSHIEDEYALDYFRQRFAEIGKEAVAHWNSLRQLRAIRDNPRPVQPRMRRATMPDVSKEG